MNRFDDQYRQFCDYMADWLMDHDEDRKTIDSLKNDRRAMIKFTRKAFGIWKKDPKMIGWLFAKERLNQQGK